MKTVNFTIYKKDVLRNVYETTVAVPENYSIIKPNFLKT